MASSIVSYTGDGAVDTFSVPFPYLSKSHIQVLVNGTPQVFTFDWLNGSTIKLHYAPASGDQVVIQRVTPLGSRLVQFQNGSVLTQQDLNTAVAQVFYIQQELQDQYDGALTDGLRRLADGMNIDFSSPQDAIDALTTEVLEHNAVNDLRQRITDISNNAEGLLSADSRINTLQATVDSLANIDGTGIVTFIQNEQQQRVAGDEALAETLGVLGAKLRAGYKLHRREPYGKHYK